jgi:TolA-binding protein
MRRGETLFGTRQYRQAIGWFQKAAENSQFRLADHALMRQAACLAQIRQYAKAADLYASLPARFPKSSRIEESNLAAGKCYYLADDWTKALKVLAKVIADRGSSLPEATHWSARSLLKQKKPKEAIALLEKTLSEASESDMEAQLRLDLADATYETPSLRSISITLYADVVKRFPKSPVADSALYMAAFTALQLEDYKTALRYAEQFFENYVSSLLLPDVMAIAAESELQLGKTGDAQRRFQDLVNRYPNHAEAPSWRLRRALLLYDQKRYPEVVKVVKPMVSRLRTAAGQAEGYYLLGSSLLQLHQFDSAISALESSLRADKSWAQADDAMLVLADAYRQKGANAQARAVIRQLIVSYPKSPLLDQAHYWLAELAYNDGDMAAAIGAYENMIRTWPKSSLLPHALFGLGWAQLAEKRYEAAEKSLDRLISEFPKDEIIPRARFARGTARQQLGKFEAGAEDVQALLATKPAGKEKLDALYVLGLCQAGLKQNEKAIATFEALLSEDSKYSGADKTLYELAWALKSAGKNREAAQRFAELARLHPNSPLAAESLFHAAEAEYDRRNYIVALTTYRDVVRTTTDPFLKERSLHRIALSYFNMRQYERAREAFNAQRKAFPKGKLVADAAFMEAETFLREKRFKKALTGYEKMFAMAAKPATKDVLAIAYLHAGQAAAELGQWKQSLKLLSEGAKRLPRSAYLPEILFEQARALKKLNRNEEAAKLYASIAGRTSQEVGARAQFMLGEMLAGQKKYSEAIRAFYDVLYGDRDYPKWQAESAYEAARCFESLNNVDQAAKLYKELVTKYPKSDKAAAAKERLEIIQR